MIEPIEDYIDSPTKWELENFRKLLHKQREENHLHPQIQNEEKLEFEFKDIVLALLILNQEFGSISLKEFKKLLGRYGYKTNKQELKDLLADIGCLTKRNGRTVVNPQIADSLLTTSEPGHEGQVRVTLTGIVLFISCLMKKTMLSFPE